MFSDRRNVCVINLYEVINAINEENMANKYDAEYIDPSSWIDLMFDEQEYGTDCYMHLRCSAREVDNAWQWYQKYSLNFSFDPVGIKMNHDRWYILYWLHERLPKDIDMVIVEVEY